MSEPSTIALYDSLARWQWWRRRWSFARAGERLEIRKRLLPPADPANGPRDGGAGLDAWLQERLGDRARTRLLDLGCGFGASTWRWLDAGVEAAVGVTPSGYQVRRAQQIATKRGCAARASFRCQSLHEDVCQSFDVVLAIEALGHSEDLGAVLSRARQSLGANGTLLLVEDLLREPQPDDPDVAQLAASWSSPRLRDAGTFEAELGSAGLRILDQVDLTAQVPHRELDAIDASVARGRKRRRWLPTRFARNIADAFVGGFALERLYARRLACYRFYMAMPEQDA